MYSCGCATDGGGLICFFLYCREKAFLINMLHKPRLWVFVRGACKAGIYMWLLSVANTYTNLLTGTICLYAPVPMYGVRTSAHIVIVFMVWQISIIFIILYVLGCEKYNLGLIVIITPTPIKNSPKETCNYYLRINLVRVYQEKQEKVETTGKKCKKYRGKCIFPRTCSVKL
uniref:Uncharacterized protein n=1 Tax=Glossina brevipalpis TaxID=37001 RepID=A0A1A9WQV8_9MUSC